MQRVYVALKARLLADTFAPGERLDPARLSNDLAASVTPVRDALQRLTGERLLESWQHEGFRVPLLVDADVRDLYDWNAALGATMIRMARRQQWVGDTGPAAIAPSIEDLFTALAAATGNTAARATIASTNDQLATLRRHEPDVIRDDGEVVTMHALLAAQDWRGLAAALQRYHRRRIGAASAIAARRHRRS